MSSSLWARKVEENEAVGMGYCELGVGVGGWVGWVGWVGGWVGRWVGWVGGWVGG